MTAQSTKRDWAAWAAVIAVLLTQLITFAFSYGGNIARLDSIDRRLEKVERVLMDRGTRAEVQ